MIAVERKLPTLPDEIQEWCWHMDLHVTEHDERHAGLALRAAWPHISEWLKANVSASKGGVAFAAPASGALENYAKHIEEANAPLFDRPASVYLAGPHWLDIVKALRSTVAPTTETPRTEADIAYMDAELGRLRFYQRNIEEAEARCCPEDFSFEEWIGILTKRLTEAKQEATEQRNLAGSLLHERDERLARSSTAAPMWIRFDSDCTVNGKLFKAGTSWGPFEKSRRAEKGSDETVSVLSAIAPNIKRLVEAVRFFQKARQQVSWNSSDMVLAANDVSEALARYELAPLSHAASTLVARCRPAVAHYMRTQERAAMSEALSQTAKQAAETEAVWLGKLLDEIDAMCGSPDGGVSES